MPHMLLLVSPEFHMMLRVAELVLWLVWFLWMLWLVLGLAVAVGLDPWLQEVEERLA